MADAPFCILIEDVCSRDINGNLNGVACSRSGTGGYASDEVLLINYDIEVYLRTHKLGHLDIGVNEVSA